MTTEPTFAVDFGAVHLLLVETKVLLVLLRARLPTTLGWVAASDSRFCPLDINTVQMKCVNTSKIYFSECEASHQCRKRENLATSSHVTEHPVHELHPAHLNSTLTNHKPPRQYHHSYLPQHHLHDVIINNYSSSTPSP